MDPQHCLHHKTTIEDIINNNCPHASHCDTNLCTVLEQTRIKPEEWHVATKPLNKIKNLNSIYSEKSLPDYNCCDS
jgi:hypothetical protein